MNLSKSISSFKYALKGLKCMLVHENNFRVHCSATLLVNFLAYYFKINITEWCIILLCCGLVMAMEIINTAIEKTIDLICPEQNPTAGLIKDIAAAAVLVMSICSLVIGILIFGKYLF
jgi:diacylglycerol kinase (ATP)